ncbi:hypothetical protein DRP04_07105 [Archaeoglobales archaeon]|nr:MAG: hypothetical protein DRP04_07105 [Archaeoglobales archaeon]
MHRKYSILQALAEGSKTSRQIAEELGLKQSYITKYLLTYRMQHLVKVVGKEKKKGRKARLWALTKRGKERLEFLKEKKS